MSEQETSPICFEFMGPYGKCYWCERQAEPMLIVYLSPDGQERTRTEICWKCHCGKRWPLQYGDLCAVIAASEWLIEVVKEGSEPTVHRIWYPNCAGDDGELFTEELRKKVQEDW